MESLHFPLSEKLSFDTEELQPGFYACGYFILSNAVALGISAAVLTIAEDSV